MMIGKHSSRLNKVLHIYLITLETIDSSDLSKLHYEKVIYGQVDSLLTYL
jgi:hypothetical protein